MGDPLDSIYAKIDRASEHIRNLNAEINTLIDGDAYRIVSEPEGDARKSSIRVIGTEPPLRLAVVAGEIVHQLRSSLDHLVCQLAIANGKPVKRSHQFPICDTPGKFKAACKRGNIKGLSASARSLIEGRQPYKKGEDIKKNFLYLLREMDDADKHRLLPVVAALANVLELRIGDDSGVRPKDDPIQIVGLDPPKKAQRPTREGTEIQRIYFGDPEPNVKVTGKPVVEVVFENVGSMTEQPVMYVVQELRDKTVALLNTFAGEFTSP